MTYQCKSSIRDIIPLHCTAYFDKRCEFFCSRQLKNFDRIPCVSNILFCSRILHTRYWVFLCREANRRCKPRHVLQRPPENRTCLHTVNSHNALPANGKLSYLSAFFLSRTQPGCLFLLVRGLFVVDRVPHLRHLGTRWTCHAC